MEFDVIVVGGGHAGIEAAYVCGKNRLRVLLITNNLDLIGQMSCNPAIGGIAKGNLVREVDALGGLMARITDKAGIHFRMLNSSKGAAVWGNRAQADKVLYRSLARQELEKLETVHLLQGMVRRIQTKGESVCGVETDSGEIINGRCVVLAMGTFLGGIIHVGLTSYPGGRAGEPPSTMLTENLREHGIQNGRLKTGTSPRIDGRSVDFSVLAVQKGDENPWPFSFSTTEPLQNRAVCWVSRTNQETHRIIRESLDRSPLYTGKIKSIGPRYCPSIEDKVVKFGERDGHTLFLEPESLGNSELYLNGLSTSLPLDVQERLVASIKGLEKARIIRPGYGIEYSYFQPNQLRSTLESKTVRNLYFAGQINGTSGYEEAACQGVVAGINAAQRVCGNQELTLPRESSYTGVLIDDLVSEGTEEPYRMFTSRAEHRLKLRQDTSDERLMPLAFRLGFVEQELFERRQRIWEIKEKAKAQLAETTVNPERWNQTTGTILEQAVRASDLLKRPEVAIGAVVECCGIYLPDEREIRLGIEADIKYSGFVAKQEEQIEKIRRLESAEIPDRFDYAAIEGLLTESRLKLAKVRPATLGKAARIPGITPADIAIIAQHIAGGRRRTGQAVSRETKTYNGTGT